MILMVFDGFPKTFMKIFKYPHIKQ